MILRFLLLSHASGRALAFSPKVRAVSRRSLSDAHFSGLAEGLWLWTSVSGRFRVSMCTALGVGHCSPNTIVTTSMCLWVTLPSLQCFLLQSPNLASSVLLGSTFACNFFCKLAASWRAD